jgi:hypothetical protein
MNLSNVQIEMFAKCDSFIFSNAYNTRSNNYNNSNSNDSDVNNNAVALLPYIILFN